jgi:hypothetical protein
VFFYTSNVNFIKRYKIMKTKILVLFFIVLAHSQVFSIEGENQDDMPKSKAQQEIDYYRAYPMNYSGEGGEIERRVSGPSSSAYGKGNDDDQVFFYMNIDTKEHKGFTVEEFAKLYEAGQGHKWKKVLSGSVNSYQKDQ